MMMSMEEMLAKKDKLCAEHYPKCITSECPLAKVFCYEEPSIVMLYTHSQMGTKRRITRILKAVK